MVSLPQLLYMKYFVGDNITILFLLHNRRLLPGLMNWVGPPLGECQGLMGQNICQQGIPSEKKKTPVVLSSMMEILSHWNLAWTILERHTRREVRKKTVRETVGTTLATSFIEKQRF